VNIPLRATGFDGFVTVPVNLPLHASTELAPLDVERTFLALAQDPSITT
jgi:hypothetical protein